MKKVLCLQMRSAQLVARVFVAMILGTTLCCHALVMLSPTFCMVVLWVLGSAMGEYAPVQWDLHLRRARKLEERKKQKKSKHRFNTSEKDWVAKVRTNEQQARVHSGMCSGHAGLKGGGKSKNKKGNKATKHKGLVPQSQTCHLPDAPVGLQNDGENVCYQNSVLQCMASLVSGMQSAGLEQITTGRAQYGPVWHNHAGLQTWRQAWVQNAPQEYKDGQQQCAANFLQWALGAHEIESFDLQFTQEITCQKCNHCDVRASVHGGGMLRVNNLRGLNAQALEKCLKDQLQEMDRVHGVECAECTRRSRDPGCNKAVWMQRWCEEREGMRVVKSDKVVVKTCNKLPQCLCVALTGRYDAHGNTSRKDDTQISIPMTMNMDGIYNLHGYVAHHGTSSNSGHYTATVLRGSEWYKCNDSLVEPVEIQSEIGNENVQRSVYLLFYQLERPAVPESQSARAGQTEQNVEQRDNEHGEWVPDAYGDWADNGDNHEPINKPESTLNRKARYSCQDGGHGLEDEYGDCEDEEYSANNGDNGGNENAPAGFECEVVIPTDEENFGIQDEDILGLEKIPKLHDNWHLCGPDRKREHMAMLIAAHMRDRPTAPPDWNDLQKPWEDLNDGCRQPSSTTEDHQN